MTEDQLKHLLERSNAALFGQLSQHFDQRFDALSSDLASRTDRIYTAVDGLTKQVETNDHERAAINAEQEHQNGWIGQLAHATNTKLVPEQ